MRERSGDKLVRMDFFVDQSVLETPRQAEQDRSNCHGTDDHPGSGCSTARVYFQRLADGDVAIDGEENYEPGIDEACAVHKRIENDEDATVDVVVSGPADMAK